MKYPRLPISMDRRRKLSESDIKEIRLLHEKGISFRAIGKLFNVSHTTIHCHCDEQFKKKINHKRYLIIKEKCKCLRYKKERNKEKNNNFLYNTRRYEPLRIYKGKATYKWKKAKYHSDEMFRKKVLEQARIARFKVKEEK